MTNLTSNKHHRFLVRSTKVALAVNIALLSNMALAQNTDATTETSAKTEVITVTGSRIPRTELVSTSPVSSVDEVQIKLDRAVNVADITAKLPQAAAGANSTGATVGDSLGSSTIDLRGLGQNRTLVLINGTRAVPFSFRNSVDVNTIPAGLIKRVDVLTGGAAAVYGADAVSGVVNFIMDDKFEGLELSTSYETPADGGEKYNADAIFGGDIANGRGHLTGYIGYSERKELLAGDRDWAMKNSPRIINTGGYYTDIASGNKFGIDDNGNITADRNTSEYAHEQYLTQPMKRLSAGLFFNLELSDHAELYGRGLYSQVRVLGAGAGGQTPITVKWSDTDNSEWVTINQSASYLTDAIRDQLTFDANGNAVVGVERNLGLGLQETKAVRDSVQLQMGVRGDITDSLQYDIYAQYGRTDETSTVYNSAYKRNAGGGNRFAALANTSNIFDPSLDLTSFGNSLVYANRERTQSVIAATVSGNSSPLFELPAGFVSYAVGYEYRKETGLQTPGDAFRQGNTYSSGGTFDMKASFDTKEVYAEVLIPLLFDLPFADQLDFEGAYRISDYSNTGSENTYKLGLNWALNSDIRFRLTRQTAIRAPNLGEFASPITALSLAQFEQGNPAFVPRFAGRYDGDPCLLGTGDAAQCARYGAPAAGTPFDASTAQYTYGGNPNIKPEQAESTTLGLVYVPSFLNGFDVTVDYYNIEITDAISQIQPGAALKNCYIDNPVAGNPLCDAVLRDPNTGFIKTALVNDLNLASIEQSGIDIATKYRFDAPEVMGGIMQVSYQANIVTKQSRQNNATVAAMDCKGTFGSSCSGDFASVLQADYKHRVALDWRLDDVTLQLGWRRIGAVDFADDRNVKISAQNYLDLAASWQVTDSVSLNAGIDNLLDKEPPLPTKGANHFNTVSDYNVVGRSFGVSVRYRPNL